MVGIYYSSIGFDGIPRFPPEVFAYLQSPNSAQFKRFREGLTQLLQEGVIQHFLTPGSPVAPS